MHNLIEEILILQRIDALSKTDRHRMEAIDACKANDHGLRSAVASLFVRIGMTLDHDAVRRAAIAR